MGWGRGNRGCPLPFFRTPGSPSPFVVRSHIFAVFRLKNITQSCVFLSISPASYHLGNPTFFPLFSRVPYTPPRFLPSFSPLSTYCTRIVTVCAFFSGKKHVLTYEMFNLQQSSVLKSSFFQNAVSLVVPEIVTAVYLSVLRSLVDIH